MYCIPTCKNKVNVIDVTVLNFLNANLPKIIPTVVELTCDTSDLGIVSLQANLLLYVNRLLFFLFIFNLEAKSFYLHEFPGIICLAYGLKNAVGAFNDSNRQAVH